MVINAYLCETENWYLRRQNVLNIDKTKCMLKGTQKRKSKSNNPVLNLQISGQIFFNFEVQKLLDVEID